MANNIIESNEVRLFSAQSKDSAWKTALIKSSRSAADARNRESVYQKIFSNYQDLKEGYKMFSGYSEVPLLSNQYFNATMASFVRSFAGFLSIERSMDQPTALLYFMDLIGATDNRVVLPNIGQENRANINARFTTSDTVTADAVTVSTGRKLIPGSVKVTLIHAADPASPIVVSDDRAGSLTAAPGVLSEATVNYSTGAITFKVGAGFVPAAGDKYTLIGIEDTGGAPDFMGSNVTSRNRFKIDMKNINVTTEPDMLIGESNLMAIAAMQKAISVNPQDVTAGKLTELYTKIVNDKLVGAIVNSHEGNAISFDITGDINKFYEFRSRLDSFSSRLVDVDTAMAHKSVKGVKATAYIVGETMSSVFRKLKSTGEFKDNEDCTYINDLIGYYNGVPVLRHDGVGTNDGYAIHKTADGQLAPAMRGIFLPLTNTPAVGNYNNPSQLAAGIYYQEANESIVPELTQKFTINANVN